MDPIGRQPPRRVSAIERAFGIAPGMLLSVAVIVGCLAAGALMLRGTREAPRPPAGDPARAQAAPPPAPLKRKPSSLDFRPRLGGLELMPEDGPPPQKTPQPPAAAAPAAPAPETVVAEPPPAAPPDLSGQVKAALKGLGSAAGAAAGDRSPSNSSGAAAPAATAAPPAAQKKPAPAATLGAGTGAAEPPEFLSGVSHDHGGGSHSHDAEGRSVGATNPHRHRRKVVAVDRQTAPSAQPPAGFNLDQTVDLYKLEQIGRRAHDEALRTGKPIEISDQEAQEIAQEIGISQGAKDKKPTTNPF